MSVHKPCPNRRVKVLAAAAALLLPGAALAATYELGPAADSFVSLQHPGTSYGADEVLFIHHGDFDTRRSYLQFDLTGLPAGEVVTGATLFLYTSGNLAGLDVDAHHVADDTWTEAALTWNNKPAYAAAAFATTASAHGWMSWSVPLSTLSADPDGRLSVLVKLQNEVDSSTVTYYSREATGGAAQGPYLQVNTVPEPRSWVMLTAGLAALGWAARRRRAG